MNSSQQRIAKVLHDSESELLSDWLKEQKSSGLRLDLMSETEFTEQSAEFLRRFSTAIQSGSSRDMHSGSWKPVRDLLSEISRSRGLQGFTPSETATFVFSLKQPLFTRLRGTEASASKPGSAAADDMWEATLILDRLGLYITEVYQKTREEVISRQQQDMLELSTPVVELWQGILALPLIGTLDSSRTQVVMETLLHRIVETGSRIAIVDITGVPTVDTQVAQHLIKTVTAARLMGAECIISGIRPQIAATIVHLGVDLGDVVTKSSLSDAFVLALRKTGAVVSKASVAQAQVGHG